MRDVTWISKIEGLSHWVKESDGLVSTSADYELGLLQVAYVDDRGVVSFELTEDRYIPGWVGLEQVDHILLKIPNDDL